ncbi:hypothetical protein ACTA71_008767 [Dictyostelium dimigraforme]
MVDNSINIGTDDKNDKKIKSTALSSFSYIDKDECYKEEQLTSCLLIYKKSNFDIAQGDDQDGIQNGEGDGVDNNSDNNQGLEIDNNNVIPPLDFSNSYGLTKQDVIKYHNDNIYIWVNQLPLSSIHLVEVVNALGNQNVETFQDVFDFDDGDWDKILPIIKVKKAFLDCLAVFNNN